jgi:hypothetical protein
MNVTILHTEDCPNLEPLLAELRSVIEGRDNVTVTTTLVRSDANAMRLGFHGSPTILIDGTDPFPGPAEPVGLSCRSYLLCRPSRTSSRVEIPQDGAPAITTSRASPAAEMRSGPYGHHPP